MSLPRAIPFSIEDRARGFFFSHYVLGKTKTFDYIQDFPPETDSRLCASLAAVSLAHFSSKANSPEVMDLARMRYVSALQRTNEALQTGSLATNDATLLSILLLDLFEKITKRTPPTFETQHINGALALAKLRGAKQFNNPVGLRLFLQLSSTVLIACIQRDIPVPADLLDLQAESRKYTNFMEPKARLSQVLIRFIDLRVAIKDRRLLSSNVVVIAKDLDADLELILRTMPPDFQYSTSISPSSKEVYENYFHVYPHRRVTHIWNLNRLVRILLNEIIIQQCLEILEFESSLSIIEEYQTEIQHSASTIALMATQICASVPQYTLLPRFSIDHSISEEGIDPTYSRIWQDFKSKGADAQNSDHTSSLPPCSPPSPSFWSELHTPFQCSRCYSLIYPLYIAAQSFASPEPLRRWVINCLHTMSADMGIKEAYLVAGVLERREEVNPWSVYAMIGSYSFST